MKPDFNDAAFCHQIECALQSAEQFSGVKLLPDDVAEDRAHWFYCNGDALVMHDLNRKFVFATKEALNAFGMEWQDFVGMESRDSASEAHQVERDELFERLENGENSVDYNVVRKKGSGEAFRMKGSLFNVKDGDALIAQAASFEYEGLEV